MNELRKKGALLTMQLKTMLRIRNGERTLEEHVCVQFAAVLCVPGTISRTTFTELKATRPSGTGILGCHVISNDPLRASAELCASVKTTRHTNADNIEKNKFKRYYEKIT